MKNNNKNLFNEYSQTIRSKAISIWYIDELSIDQITFLMIICVNAQ